METTTASAPFLHGAETTRLCMADAAIALLPTVAGAIWFFGWHGALTLLSALLGCLGAEALWQRTGRGCLRDGSAAVSGLLLGLLLPADCPWWAALAAGALAASSKAAFGGLGRNVLNPAAFARVLLLPLAPSAAPAAGGAWPLLMAYTGGALGETSSLLVVAGAFYLALRRLLPWAVTVPFLASAAVVGACLPGCGPLTVLCWGGTLLAGCFLAADPVTSPMGLQLRLLCGVFAGAACTLLAWLGWGIGGAAAGILAANLLFRGAEWLLCRLRRRAL